MKKVLIIISVLVLTVSVFLPLQLKAQAPQKMSYQAVVRNSSNNLVTNTNIGMQISILQGSASGTPVYVERQFPTTNENGLVSIIIGNGTIVSGTFDAIDWSSGLYFIKSETDLNGGANYTISGTSQLLSVPYALNAKYAETSGSSSTEKVAFHVSGSGSWQSVTSTDTYINWTDEEYDLSNNFASNVFTVPSDGIYHFDAVVDISFGSASSNQMILLSIYKNGSIVECSKIQGSSSISLSGILNTSLSLMTGDEIKLGIRLIYGSGINVDGAGKQGTHFSGFKVY